MRGGKDRLTQCVVSPYKYVVRDITSSISMSYPPATAPIASGAMAGWNRKAMGPNIGASGCCDQRGVHGMSEKSEWWDTSQESEDRGRKANVPSATGRRRGMCFCFYHLFPFLCEHPNVSQ